MAFSSSRGIFCFLQRTQFQRGRTGARRSARSGNQAASWARRNWIWPRSQSNDGDGEAYITPKSFAALIRSRNLPNLQHLQLRSTDVGDDGMRVLVKSGILKRLETLDLRSGCISDAGARTLAGCPDLKRLKRFDLSRNELTEHGIAALNAVGIPVNVERQHGSTADAEPYDRDFLYEGDIE